MMEVVVTTGATRCAKLQSNRHHKPTPSCLQARCPSWHQINSVKALKVNNINERIECINEHPLQVIMMITWCNGSGIIIKDVTFECFA